MKIARLEQENKLLKENSDAGTNIVANEMRDIKFANFSMDFKSCVLKTLRSMQNDSGTDRKFIRVALESFYPGELLLQLKQKSLFGCKPKKIVTKTGIIKETTEKIPLTPKKVKVLRNLFSERIAAAELNDFEMSLRMRTTYFNQLIATALSNLQRKI